MLKLFRELDLSDLESRTTLILSDAFPPYSTGGAEISLRASIDALPLHMRSETVIISFADVKEFEISNYHGAFVIHAPSVAAWPYEKFSSDQFDVVRQNTVIGERNMARIIRLKKTLLGPNSSDARLAYAESRWKPMGNIMIDHLLSDADLRIKVGKSLIDKMPLLDLIVADNTRSILLGHKLIENMLPRPRSVAIVRDNRFHCARPSQSRIVNKKVCKQCDFRCAEEDIRANDDTTASIAIGQKYRREALKKTDAFRQKALQGYDAVVVTSHELKRHVSQRLGREQPIVRIPNSTEPVERIDRRVTAIPQSGTPRLLIIGMLNENKGQFEFIRAARDWLLANKDVKIVLAGRGSRIETKIREFAKKNKIAHQIEFKGYLSRQLLFEEIAKARLVLAPTIWPEPFGRVPLEAGAARRAVIAFAAGGLNESIVHNHTGILVERGNYDAFLNAIDQLLDDASTRIDIEQNARTWVAETYSAEHTTKRFVEEVFGV